MRIALSAILVLGCLAATSPASAVEPDEVLADSGLEARARAISRELRCLVCQNQSIDDSGAPLARDLRLLVRERLKAGASDAEVIDHVVARYGDFVLLRPPFKASTLALWAGPWMVLAAGIAWIVIRRRRARRDGAREPEPLSADERRRLEMVLGGQDK